jgi:glycerol-3-phosphate dehydrogenase
MPGWKVPVVSEHFDVLVTGGGIHGVGVAQAAACAGYSVLLLEQDALASGTSSRSSKLIHGGLRYLEGYDFGLVRESLSERATLLKIAPELVQLQPFHIPVYPETSRGPLTIRAGLSLYALLGGLRKASRFRKLARHEWGGLDGLETDRLKAVYQYYDAQTNDADLTHAVMQSAIDYGAVLKCSSEFISASIGERGCEVHYQENGVNKSCTAKVVVNAGGPWATTIAERITPAQPPVEVDLVQGAHLIMEGGLDKGCYYLEAPQDRRAIFLLPWGGHSLLGTTEHVFHGDPANVAVLAAEESYLLDVIQHYFPGRSRQVVDRFAGLRVLPVSANAAFKRSRETRLPVDDPDRPRLVSIYGGKLTGYRATAQKVLDVMQRTLPERKLLAKTSELVLNPV